MKVAPITEIRQEFEAYVSNCREEPVLVTKEGKMVAVLLSVENEDELERLLPTCSPGFRKILDAGRQQIREGRGIRHEDFWQEMESEP